MPKIDREQIGIAFHMQGCPNRCRLCWLGPSSSRRPSVATWFWEPDFSDDYRAMYDLEAELSDGNPARYELLSIWRLARDESYANWAKSVGPDTCQI